MKSLSRVPLVFAALVLSSCSSHANSVLPAATHAQNAFARGAAQYSETILFNFSSPGSGANFTSPLTPDGHGDYFGTTEVGGTGHGTVYELTPDGAGGWKETTLYAFTGFYDGGEPVFTPLLIDKHGNVYGTTNNGGANEYGVVYELKRSNGTWSEHVIWNFGGAAGGVNPFSTLVADSKGDLFGTDNLYRDGHPITEGVYELSPIANGWTYKIIFDDGIPSATSGGGGLTIDAKGNVFGITSLAFQPSEVFKLWPNGNSWTSTILYTFPSIRGYPEAPPVLDEMGNIYGATAAGGPKNDGTIYELMPSNNGPWKRKTLYAFTGSPADGAAPYGSVKFDASGNIYDTTFAGGAFHHGTVVELTASNGKYEPKLLWSFDAKDGSQPLTAVTVDASGDVFGTTTQGNGRHECFGGYGCGNAFEIKR